MTIHQDILKQLEENVVEALAALESYHQATKEPEDETQTLQEALDEISEDLVSVEDRLFTLENKGENRYDSLAGRITVLENILDDVGAHRHNYQDALEKRLTRIERALASLHKAAGPAVQDLGTTLINGLVDNLLKK